MSVGELEMTPRISAVAVCCSTASASRFLAARTLSAVLFADLRATACFGSLAFSFCVPRPLRLTSPPGNRPGTGYGERARLGNYEQLGLAEGHPWDLLMRTASSPSPPSPANTPSPSRGTSSSRW